MSEDNFAMGYAMGQDAGGNRNQSDGFWGGDGVWGFLILALLFGGGNWGFGGNRGQGDAQGAVSSGFALNGLENGIRGIQQGLCDGFYAVNTGLLTGFGNIQSQLAECCCGTQRSIDGVKYDMATGFCNLGNTIQTMGRDIIESNNAGVRSILDFITQDKIATLTAENQALRFAASQTAQNQFITQVGSDIVNRLQPPAVPSYTVPNPYASYGSCGYCNG